MASWEGRGRGHGGGGVKRQICSTHNERKPFVPWDLIPAFFSRDKNYNKKKLINKQNKQKKMAAYMAIKH